MGVRFRTAGRRRSGSAGAGQKGGPAACQIFRHPSKLIEVHASETARVDQVPTTRAVEPLEASKLAAGALVAGGLRQRGDG